MCRWDPCLCLDLAIRGEVLAKRDWQALWAGVCPHLSRWGCRIEATGGSSGRKASCREEGGGKEGEGSDCPWRRLGEICNDVLGKNQIEKTNPAVEGVRGHTGKGFNGKQVAASRRKTLIEKREIKIVIQYCWLLLWKCEETSPGCSARHWEEKEATWDGEWRPKFSASCKWGSCEKGIKGPQKSE